jgi:hypothetical protein
MIRHVGLVWHNTLSCEHCDGVGLWPTLRMRVFFLLFLNGHEDEVHDV